MAAIGLGEATVCRYPASALAVLVPMPQQSAVARRAKAEGVIRPVVSAAAQSFSPKSPYVDRARRLFVMRRRITRDVAAESGGLRLRLKPSYGLRSLRDLNGSPPCISRIRTATAPEQVSIHSKNDRKSLCFWEMYTTMPFTINGTIMPCWGSGDLGKLTYVLSRKPE
jgi:hypothetical protein